MSVGVTILHPKELVGLWSRGEIAVVHPDDAVVTIQTSCSSKQEQDGGQGA